MIVFMYYNKNWILPIFGFIVGTITNWLALKVIFRPIDPHKIGPFTLQGIFLKRQKEVSETYSRIICVNILHAEAMWNSVLNGPLRDNFYAMMRAHSLVFVEKSIRGLRDIAIAAMGQKTFAEMKEHIATKILDQFPTIINHSYLYLTEALEIEKTMREKMQSLSPAEFEGVLHPAFEEDEFLLIMVGGFLGLVAGLLQILVVDYL